MKPPVIVDLFCCAGGAAKGYHDAGFDVIGVDINAQPNYPYEFVQGDVFELINDLLIAYQPVAVHASPSCHDHTPLSSVAGLDGTGFQLAAIRKILDDIGLPYVIENVPGADMRRDLWLCGGMFGLRLVRHRWFELSGFSVAQPQHPEHTVPTATKQRRQRWAEGWNVSITGDVGTYVGPEAMGIDWMTGNELSQAIPPAYTQFIGEQLMAAIGVTAS